MSESSPTAVLERLMRVTNAHDIDALVDCFTEDYRNETPVHPARSFTGRAQVRVNWTQIFTAVPDIESAVLSSVEHGDTVWSEMEMRGTRRDGAAHLMRGVIIFRVDGDRIAAARFYLEPVDHGDADVTAAVRALTTSPQ